VAKRTVIAWSPLLTGRDPASWPDPMRFDPDRHLDRAEPEYAWVPFGAGSRSCLGFGLARTNLTLLASRLAQRVDLAPGWATLPAPVGMVTSHPVGGVPVTVTARR
jgi:cytochrome P450